MLCLGFLPTAVEDKSHLKLREKPEQRRGSHTEPANVDSAEMLKCMKRQNEASGKSRNEMLGCVRRSDTTGPVVTTRTPARQT